MMDVANRVIITGGAEFIGSNPAEELGNRGYKVTIIDDLSIGRMENIESLLNEGKVEFVSGSITGLPLLKKIFQNARYIFHEAAIPSVPRSIKNPVKSLLTELLMYSWLPGTMV